MESNQWPTRQTRKRVQTPVAFTGVFANTRGRLASRRLTASGSRPRGVKHRHKAYHTNFQVAKQAVVEELQAWAASVRAGEVTKAAIEVAA